MRISRNCQRLAAKLLSALFAVGSLAQSAAPVNPVDLAQKQVVAYLVDLADLSCQETVLQEKLAVNGHVDASERTKYDYFILIDGDADNFQLTESRTAASEAAHSKHALLVTNGFSTLLLIFHPYYRNSFEFTSGTNEVVDGRTLVPIHFTHIPGARTPAALAVRGRDYALELRGTAWIDEKSGQVVKMEASLQHDMSDVGLRALTVEVDYELTSRGKTFKSLVLPVKAVVDVQTIRQHWRNTHAFKDYETFSTSAVQDGNVKIVQSATPENKDSSPSPKEKP